MKIKKKFVCVYLLLLLGLGLLGNFVPQAYMAPTGEKFVTYIDSAPASVSSVDVDSEGRVFVIASGKLYRSLDNGAMWNQTPPYMNGVNGHFLWIDSNDYIHVANVTGGAGYEASFYRSTDNGATFTNTTDGGIYSPWKMGESANGTLYVNTYSTNEDDIVWYSQDDGASWSVWWNFGNDTVNHLHSVRVNPYNDDVWIVSGDGLDGRSSIVYRYNTDNSTMQIIYNGSATYFTDIMFDETYVYLVPDTHTIYERMLHKGTWADRVNVFNIGIDDDSNAGGAPFSMMSVNYAELGFMLAATDISTVLASLDGHRWIKILETEGNDTGQIAWRFTKLSSRAPLYVVNYKYGLLYRIDITKEDIAQLIQTEWFDTEGMGSITDAAEYVIETVLSNGSNFVSLSNVALTDAVARLRGIGFRNTMYDFANFHWEWGNLTGWTFQVLDGSPLYETQSTYADFGTYALNASLDVSDMLYFYQKTANLSVVSGDKIRFGVQVKAHDVGDDINWLLQIRRVDNNAVLLQIGQTSETASDTNWHNNTGSWTSTYTGDVYLAILVNVYYTLTSQTHQYFDSFFLTKLKPVDPFPISNPVADGNTYVDKIRTANMTVGDILFKNEWLNSLEPSIVVNGQTLSVDGTLNNNTLSTESVSLGTVTGYLDVEANLTQPIDEIILRINGTRLFSSMNVSLQGVTSNNIAFYGRYVTFPTIPTWVTHLAAITHISATISSVTYVTDRLTFNISSPKGTTSTTKVYCGIRGEPTAIYSANGTLAWSYNSSNTLLTLNVTHTSPTRILVYWKFPGDIDSDGDVDVEDLCIISVAYGSHVGDPTYNSDSDIDGNDDIDSHDLYIFAGNYGKTSP